MITNERQTQKNIRHILIHEGSHLYVSDLCYTRFSKEITSLQSPEKNKIPSFFIIENFDESLIRSLTLYIEYTGFNRLNWEEELRDATANGYYYTTAILPYLKYYDKEEYENFETFLQVLLNHLDSK